MITVQGAAAVLQHWRHGRHLPRSQHGQRSVSVLGSKAGGQAASRGLGMKDFGGLVPHACSPQNDFITSGRVQREPPVTPPWARTSRSLNSAASGAGMRFRDDTQCSAGQSPQGRGTQPRGSQHPVAGVQLSGTHATAQLLPKSVTGEQRQGGINGVSAVESFSPVFNFRCWHLPCAHTEGVARVFSLFFFY